MYTIIVYQSIGKKEDNKNTERTAKIPGYVAEAFFERHQQNCIEQHQQG